MGLQRKKAASFVLRCWSDTNVQKGPWRGEIEHVQSQRKKAFHGLEQVSLLLDDLLNAIQQEDGEAKGKEGRE